MPTNDKTNQPMTPAALRAVMKELYLRDHADDYALADDPRDDSEILRDHIRAVAQEMRAESIAMQVNTHDPFVEPGTREAEIAAAKRLAVFADRLEGRES